MYLAKHYTQLIYLDKLIQKQRTGTPDQLARKLGISRRSVFRLIDLLKSLDAPICYCRISERYYYSSPFNLEDELNIINLF